MAILPILLAAALGLSSGPWGKKKSLVPADSLSTPKPAAEAPALLTEELPAFPGGEPALLNQLRQQLPKSFVLPAGIKEPYLSVRVNAAGKPEAAALRYPDGCGWTADAYSPTAQAIFMALQNLPSWSTPRINGQPASVEINIALPPDFFGKK